MSWYDRIAPLYDIGSAGSGRPRRYTVGQLRRDAGSAALGIGCGTGPHLPVLLSVIGRSRR